MKMQAGLIALALALTPSGAHAQGFINLQLGFDMRPALQPVGPGIQVVEGIGEEVFFSNGWYWCRRPNGWYRSPVWGARFEWVEGRFVPGGLRGFPIGRYRNWHHEGWRPEPRRGEVHGVAPRAVERHEEHKEVKREERREEEHRH